MRCSEIVLCVCIFPLFLYMVSLSSVAVVTLSCFQPRYPDVRQWGIYSDCLSLSPYGEPVKWFSNFQAVWSFRRTCFSSTQRFVGSMISSLVLCTMLVLLLSDNMPLIVKLWSKMLIDFIDCNAITDTPNLDIKKKNFLCSWVHADCVCEVFLYLYWRQQMTLYWINLLELALGYYVATVHHTRRHLVGISNRAWGEERFICISRQ